MDQLFGKKMSPNIGEFLEIWFGHFCIVEKFATHRTTNSNWYCGRDNNKNEIKISISLNNQSIKNKTQGSSGSTRYGHQFCSRDFSLATEQE